MRLPFLICGHCMSCLLMFFSPCPGHQVTMTPTISLAFLPVSPATDPRKSLADYQSHIKPAVDYLQALQITDAAVLRDHLGTVSIINCSSPPAPTARHRPRTFHRRTSTFNGKLKLSKRETPALQYVSPCNVLFLSKKSFAGICAQSAGRMALGACRPWRRARPP